MLEEGLEEVHTAAEVEAEVEVAVEGAMVPMYFSPQHSLRI